MCRLRCGRPPAGRPACRDRPGRNPGSSRTAANDPIGATLRFPAAGHMLEGEGIRSTLSAEPDQVIPVVDDQDGGRLARRLPSIHPDSRWTFRVTSSAGAACGRPGRSTRASPGRSRPAERWVAWRQFMRPGEVPCRAENRSETSIQMIDPAVVQADLDRRTIPRARSGQVDPLDPRTDVIPQGRQDQVPILTSGGHAGPVRHGTPGR